MSLGLIIMNDGQNVDDAMHILNENKQAIIDKCKNYIVYTKHEKGQFMKSLATVDEIFAVTYDVTNEEKFTSNYIDHFSVLVRMNDDGLSIIDISTNGADSCQELND